VVVSAAGVTNALISVVVPCFDVEAFVDECIASVLEQQDVQVEVIAVDDGSTDTTGGRLDKWALIDARVHVIHQKNRGLGAARNAGTARASGGTLFFLDGDDLLPARALSMLSRSMAETGSDMVSGIVSQFDGERQWRSGLYGPDFNENRQGTHIFDRPGLVTDQMACSKLFRKGFWDESEFQFPESTLFEDALVVTRAHCTASQVDLIGETTYLWRLRESSITSDRFREGSVAQRFAVVEQVDDYLREAAPDVLWRAHGAKVFRHDLRLYGRLAVRAGSAAFSEFMRHAAPVVPKLHPAASGDASRVASRMAEFIIAGDDVGARACALLLTDPAGRSVREIMRGLWEPWPRHPLTGMSVARAAIASLR
jgi:hypothetical protein